MSHSKPVLAGILAAGLAWFAPAGYANEAENPEADPRPSFESLDANLDGVITPGEAEGSWLAAVFAEVDINQNGLIDRNEYESAIS
jgi:hypothetical protein